MNVSKKLKQLMKILLVVFMSFTVIVPDGLVKAENQYLSTDKTSYEYGEPVLVTVKDYTLADEKNTWTWVGLYKKDETPAPQVSTSWYYLLNHNAVNIISDVECKANDGQLNHQYKLDEGGDFKVILFNTDGG